MAIMYVRRQCNALLLRDLRGFIEKPTYIILH